MAIDSFEFLHNNTIFGLSNSRAEIDTIVPECGSNTDTTGGTTGTRTASSTFTSSTIKTPTSLSSKSKFKSPYLASDKVHMVSRRTEQTCMQKTATSIVSSFPYAADIYKASSDQFKALRNNKKRKPKKSVLTLPTQPAPMPQECTVSDMNESEYYMRDDLEKNKPKRITQMKKKKTKSKKIQKIVDRDLKYCRQFNIDMYCSSTDSTTKADCSELKSKCKSVTKTPNNHNPQDVWSVLQSINKFQFRPTPESSVGSKKKKAIKKFRKDRDRAVNNVFASCCTTEEFAYISTVDIQQDEECKKSTSSEITVIDERDQFARLCKRATQNVRERLALKEKQKLVQNVRRPTPPKYKKPGIAQVNARNARRKVLLKNALQNENKYSVVTDFTENETRSNIKSEKSSTISLDLQNNVPLGVSDNRHRKYISFGKNLNKGDEAVETVKKQKDPIDIIKVILHKGKHHNTGRRPPSPHKERKPRLYTTLTSAPYVAPHLTKTELGKQLYRLKYPIVVLGREEPKADMKIKLKDCPKSKMDKIMNTDVEAVYKPKREVSSYSRSQQSRKSIRNLKDKVLEILSKKSSMIKSNIQSLANKVGSDNNKKTIGGYSFRSTGTNVDYALEKGVQRNPTKLAISNVEFPIRNHRSPPGSPTMQREKGCKSQGNNEFINNVIQKVSTGVYYSQNCNKIQSLVNKVGSDNNKKTKDGESFRSTGTNVDYALEKGFQSIPSKLAICNVEVPIRNNRSTGSPTVMLRGKGTFCKAQSNDEFIDNVIQKVSAGVYYSQNKKKIQSFGYKEASIQTLSDAKKIASSAREQDTKEEQNQLRAEVKNIYKKIDPLNAIGFDDVVSGLEIESLNESQIAVKHCVTNIVIHFDVIVLPVAPNVPMHIQGISCKPLHNATGSVREFKCDNIIINNILPAELCTVMPKMMRDILRTVGAPSISSELLPQVKTPEKTKPETILPTISEAIIKNDVAKLSKEVLDIIEGNFKAVADRAIFKANTVDNIFDVRRRSDLLTTPKTLWHLHAKVRAMPRIKEKLLSFSNQSFSNATINTLKTVPHCTALQPYIRREPRLISYDEYTLSNMARNIINFFMGQPISNSSSYLYPLLNTILDRKLTMNIELESSHGSSMLKLDKDGIVARITNNSYVNNNEPVTIVDYVEPDTSANDIVQNNEETFKSIKTLETLESVDHDDSEMKSPVLFKDIEVSSKELQEKCANIVKSERNKNPKNKKKRFVKLYRKCKSATSISEKPAGTPLAKITSLEEFFQALGPDKSLASVFDGPPGKKILECLNEMSSWITEITSKQAMLVLLLVNKKETPSLTRFRLIILQAIAVKRITRASELDMEIEVIEREKFQINSDVGNNTWMPALPQNDDLLEELCWIAKTTASDYQRPFDGSSEALLKSLIEKRKQLNPSYLRVMARYVGLGLLKTQSKN